MVTLQADPGGAARALEFLILTAARTNMVTKVEWSEICGDNWQVPASRMKAGSEFVVPLSTDACALLARLPKSSLGIFPGDRLRKPHLSNGAMDALLKRLGFAHITVHGFRSAFRDWAAETTAFSGEVVEMALAHAIKDKTEAAYRRGALLEKRRELMEAWETYLARPH